MLYALSVIGICVVMICLPFCQTFNTVLAACIFYGIFAGGIPGNGPMVYSESFKEDLPSAMGIASIGRALSALSLTTQITGKVQTFFIHTNYHH